MNTYAWLVRREFWENRAIWMIPAVFGGLLILAALFGRVDIMTIHSALETRVVGRMFLVIFGLLFYVLMSIYATFYFLDCLFADRKDRSILFWKSLPVSDTQTVLSKLLVGIIIVPLVYFAIGDVTALIVAFIISVRAHSTIGATLWQGDLWLQVQGLWIYLVVITAIWYLPLVAWLMLISAYARRATMLWSVLPPLVLYIIERYFFGTNVIGHIIVERTLGAGYAAFHNGGAGLWDNAALDGGPVTKASANIWDAMDISGFFTYAGTWIGFAVGVLLIVGTIQLRMRRTEH